MLSPSTIQDIIKDKIRDIDDEFIVIDERRTELHKQRRALVTTLEIFGGADSVPHSTGTPAVRDLPTSEVPDAIYGILEESGALHRQEIFKRLTDMGAQIRGQNPVNSMGAYLSRDPRFVSVGGGRWTLVGQFDADSAPSESGKLDDAIFAVLSAERPLHRRVIYNRVVEMGVTVRGEHAINNLGAHMSHDPRFRSLGGGMWDLVDPLQTNGDDSQDEEDEEENVLGKPKRR